MSNEFHSITEFRANIYSMIDHVLETGEPVLLRRNHDGRIIEVRERVKKRAKTAPKKLRDLSKIIPMDCMTEPPEWYISPKLSEWSGEIDPNIR